MKKLLVAIALVSISFSGFAQEDAEFKAELKELIEAQAGATMDSALDQVITMIPADKQEAFKKEVAAKMPSMYEKSVDLYIEVIGKEDLKKMLAFYDTPAGQRILEKTPELMTKSMQLGQTWAMTNLQPIIQKYMAQ